MESYSIWPFLSFSIMFSRFIRVVVCISTSFFFKGCQIFCCMDMLQFAYQFIHWWTLELFPYFVSFRQGSLSCAACCLMSQNPQNLCLMSCLCFHCPAWESIWSGLEVDLLCPGFLMFLPSLVIILHMPGLPVGGSGGAVHLRIYVFAQVGCLVLWSWVKCSSDLELRLRGALGVPPTPHHILSLPTMGPRDWESTLSQTSHQLYDRGSGIRV